MCDPGGNLSQAALIAQTSLQMIPENSEIKVTVVTLRRMI
jgi:hypothetical protein